MIHLRIPENEIDQLIVRLEDISTPDSWTVKYIQVLKGRITVARSRAQRIAPVPEGATHFRIISGKRHYYKPGARDTAMAWSYSQRQWMDTAFKHTQLEECEHV